MTYLQPEVLAPAGNMDMLCAAVYAGADAVYLGLQQFNARRSAQNFDEETLQKAVAFCHARDVKVYVTLNTTIYPGELHRLAQCVQMGAGAGVDAFIVQDFAAAQFVKNIAPTMQLHASTQMSVHNLAGAKVLAKEGFTRVILARELSLPEIAEITQNCGIETEVFIHGALCMSVSGQCYMSAFFGGRSGNRGACAGPCRLPFSAGQAGECHLSLKDMSHIPHIEALQQIGVASVKIEGRLRSPEYVAAAVNACVQTREGQHYDAKLLQDVFSRSGFTDSYITGKRDATMFGIRTQEDTLAARKAAPQLRELYRRERSFVPVTMALSFEENTVCVTIKDQNGHTVTETQTIELQTPHNDPTEAYRKALEKTGGTPFYVKEVCFPDGTNWFVPASVLNQMRRDGLEQLLKQREVLQPVPCTQWKQAPLALAHGVSNHKLILRFEQVKQIPAQLLDREYRLVLPIATWESVPEELRSKTWLELPRMLFGAAGQTMQKHIDASKTQKFAGYVATNLGHLELLKDVPFFADFGLHVTNPIAVQHWARNGARLLTLSPELMLEDMAVLQSPVPVTMLAYGHMPVMLTRACPLHNVHTCENCEKQGLLVDRKNMEIPLRCEGPAGVRTIYNPVPIYMGDKVQQIPTEYLTIYFTIESEEEVTRVMDVFCKGEPLDTAFTRGLYFKGTG